MFLEVKNPKNRTPKVDLHPNSIFKSHHFVVIILIHLYIHSSRQTIGPRDTSVRDITKNWWFLKQNFGWKTTFGFGFLKFFTSKNMPPTWWNGGWKNFKISNTHTHKVPQIRVVSRQAGGQAIMTELNWLDHQASQARQRLSVQYGGVDNTRVGLLSHFYKMNNQKCNFHVHQSCLTLLPYGFTLPPSNPNFVYESANHHICNKCSATRRWEILCGR